MPPDLAPPSNRKVGLTALLFALTLPTVAAWAYFGLDGEASQLRKAAYGFGKVVQFGLPLVWWLAVRRQWPRLPLSPGDRTGILAGIAFGGAIVAGTLLVYHGWLAPAGYFESPGRVIQGRMIGFGVDTPPAYMGLAAFYSLVHSFLEEYYWRWFVFGALRDRMGAWPAIAVSSLGFMAHHVIILSVYFGWLTPASVFFSIAVAAGGAFWAWLYHRTDSLAGPWLSHLLADVAIFAVGFDLVRPLLGL